MPSRTLAAADPRLQPQLFALADAVRAHDDEVARQISRRLRLRLNAEAGRSDAAGLEAARNLLEGFERVLEGRRLIGTLDLELRVRPLPDQPAASVVLLARSRSKARVELRPGGALLRVHRMTLSPEGQESRHVRTIGVGNLTALALAEGWVEVPLATFATTIPSNALGARTRWTLDLLAGEVLEEEEAFPAQEVLVAGAERVDLAPFLSNAAIEPGELAAYVQRREVALAPILERTVRIAPERRDEALDLLTPLVEGMVPEQIARLVPTLRWLSRTGLPGRDPLAWREWLRRRSAVRAEVRWP